MSNWQEQQKQVATGVTDGSRKTPQTEALKLALEALETAWYHVGTFCPTDEAIELYDEARAAIKKALAQSAVAEQHKQEPVPAAMKTVIEAMQQDPDYAWGWHCNIAMSFVDAGGDHYTGNQGAARFMRTLANVEPAHELPFSPPQRIWVGLTDEETAELVHRYAFYELTRQIEAKLKEKNT